MFEDSVLGSLLELGMDPFQSYNCTKLDAWVAWSAIHVKQYSCGDHLHAQVHDGTDQREYHCKNILAFTTAGTL